MERGRASRAASIGRIELSERAMSKGKYKRQRQRAQQHAKQHARQVRLLGVAIPLKERPEPAEQSQSQRKDEKEKPMGLREAAKRSTVTDWLLASFTFVLAVVAIYQFVVMSGQLAVMRRDQRPWIKVSFTKADMKAFSKDIGEVHFTNIGKTPALHFHAKYIGQFLDSNQSPNLDLTGPISGVTTGTVFPGSDDEQKDPVEHIVGGKVVNFTPDEIEDYNRGDKYIAFVIRVTYTDSTGGDYWTQYCEFHGEGGRMIPVRNCTDYNSTDQQ
jgi:hypothetical protein